MQWRWFEEVSTLLLQRRNGKYIQCSKNIFFMLSCILFKLGNVSYFYLFIYATQKTIKENK